MPLSAKQRAMLGGTPRLDHLAMEVLSDEGFWIDLNDPISYEATGAEYPKSILVRKPTISFSEDSGGQIYLPSISTLECWNLPRRLESGSHGPGFWDEAFPVEIDGVFFSSWIGRSLRFKIYSRIGGDAPGSYPAQSIDGFRIEDVRTSGNKAQLDISGPLQRLQEVDLSDVRWGGGPWRGIRYGNLYRKIAARAGLSITVPTNFDLPDFAAERAQLLGACPGWSQNNRPYPDHWVPRAWCQDFDNPDRILVSFECPGTPALPGGAVYAYNVVSGYWQKLLGAGEVSEINFGNGYLTSLLDLGDFYLYGDQFVRQPSNNTKGGRQVFATLRVKKVNIAGGNMGGSYTPAFPVWPCQETYAQGGLRANTDSICGCAESLFRTAGSNVEGHWYSDTMALPFPQVIEAGVDRWFNETTHPWYQDFNWPTDPITNRYAIWSGTILNKCCADEIGDLLEKRDTSTTPTVDLCSPGLWSAWVDISTGSAQFEEEGGTFDGFGWQFYMHDKVLARSMHFRTTTDEDWFIWLGTPLSDHDWFVYASNATDETTTWERPIFPEASSFWRRQPLCWCPVTYAGSTVAMEFLVSFFYRPFNENAVVDANKVPTALHSYCFLYSMSFNPTTGGLSYAARVSFNFSASDTTQALVVVDLMDLDQPVTANGRYKGAFFVASILDRNRIGGLCYSVGLGWYNAGTGAVTWMDYVGDADYGGPQSSAPFSGFVMGGQDGASTSANVVYFIDQATGQVWSLRTTGHGTPPIWSMLNRGRAIHPTETWLSNPRGIYVGAIQGETSHQPSDGYDRIFWTTAPGPNYDVKAWWERPLSNSAKLRWDPGAYSLVQFSTKQEDVIDVADLEGMTGIDGIRQLLELTPDYYLRPSLSGTGTLEVEKRGTITTPQATFVSPESKLYPVPSDDEIRMLDSDWMKQDNRRQIVNECTVTPWGLVPQGEPSIQVLRAPGSAFTGDFLYDVRSESAVSIRISCVAGGDPTTASYDAYSNSVASPEVNTGCLWRWEPLSGTSTVYLSAVCVSLSTSIFVEGIEQEPDGRFVVGSDRVEIRVGDVIQVDGGTQRTITGITVTLGSDATSVALDGSVGVDAPATTLVRIEPGDSNSRASDSPDLAPVLTAAISSGSVGDIVNIQIDRPYDLTHHMGFRIGRELFIVRAVGRGGASGISCIRGMFGTEPEAHSIGDSVLRYLRTSEAGRLYAVGDTGVFFGVSVKYGTELAQRMMSPGDGVIVRSDGASATPLKNVRIRSVDAASVERYGSKAKQIVKNRFVGLVQGETLADATVAEWAEPFTELKGIKTVFFEDLFLFSTVYAVDDPRIATGTVARPTGVKIDLESWTSTWDLRTIGVIATAGPGVATGIGIGAGMRRPFGGSGRGTLAFSSAFDLSFGGGPIAFSSAFERNSFY